MTATTLLQRPSISVSDFRCSARAGRYAVRRAAIAVTRSPMCARAASAAIAAAARSNWWRDRSWSAIPATNMSAPTITSAATSACRSFWTPELVETIGDRPEIWRVGAAPPLPELMVLGELAQAAADGRSDIGLDEVGQLFASRFVEVVSGTPRKRRRPPRPGIAAARWKPRCGSMRIRTRQIDLERSAAQAGISPFHFLRLFAERARRHPAPIPGALAAAPRGAPVGRRRQAHHRYRLRCRVRRSLQFRAHLPPRRRRLAAQVP